MKTTLLCLLIAALGAGCLRVDHTPPASDTSAVRETTATPTPATPAPAAAPAAAPAPGATKLAVVEGFLTPESVLHDPVQDIYFVSNINGGPTTKDNNGFISRVRPEGAGHPRGHAVGSGHRRGPLVRREDRRPEGQREPGRPGRRIPERHCDRADRRAVHHRHRHSVRRRGQHAPPRPDR